MISLNKNLKRGEEYTSLKPSYIIFICQFDCFAMDAAIYFFQYADIQKSLPLGDNSYIIVVNTKCSKEVPESLKTLFDYINEGRVDAGDDFIEKIHSEVMALQQNEEVAQLMTMEEEYERRNTAAHCEGRDEGEAIGIAKGEAVGLKKGRAEAFAELARTMKASGEDTDKIAGYTGITLEEIARL